MVYPSKSLYLYKLRRLKKSSSFGIVRNIAVYQDFYGKERERIMGKKNKKEQNYLRREQILSLEYYNYKGIFTGSMKAMNYRIEKKEEEEKKSFLVHIWKGPYNFEATSKEEMRKKEFPFTNEGAEEVTGWINEVFTSDFM